MRSAVQGLRDYHWIGIGAALSSLADYRRIKTFFAVALDELRASHHFQASPRIDGMKGPAA